MKIAIKLLLSLHILLFSQFTRAENGYELWLRYAPIENEQLLSHYRQLVDGFQLAGSSDTHQVIAAELTRGLSSLLAQPVQQKKNGSLSVQVQHPLVLKELSQLNDDGYVIKQVDEQLVLSANSETGLLYGTFGLLRLLQTQQRLNGISLSEQPKIQQRILNHWDNLDRTSERGYAGFSLWDWHKLPAYLDQRYVDYARANASIGINGTVLTNVNANSLVLTPTYLQKVKALADVFRPYGIRVYLTARFSAPIEIGGLPTADPLDAAVIEWWTQKAAEIYEHIPDFGGFLVKANSEGQPGPQNYGRTHADGANMMAKALQPYGGIVMWRAFVYSNEEPEDRAKQAYNEFMALDGQFLSNVIIQVKNGPIDFQPREPFHPLFGAMKATPLAMEFQITQEYLGQATQLVYLAPMYEECLQSDTYAKGKGSTVATVIDGSLHQQPLSAIAGVANTGTDINWTGHPFAQSNWYAFGRLAWNHALSATAIAREWVQMTWTPHEKARQTIAAIMHTSWPASVHYMTPLGLHHLMGTGHHYGPAPWVNSLSRADWNPVYYHKADNQGIGFDRTTAGSGATAQYFPEVANRFNDPAQCPEELLLWFHHLPWNYQMASGKPLWEELALSYQQGINQVRRMQQQWQSLEQLIDKERHTSVHMLLDIQEQEAIWWKDACLLYFQQFSQRPLPKKVEKPQHDLQYYQSLKFPFAPGH